MPDQPLFSVILPVYNREEMLVRAVESVRAQGFQDYEIVVIDDASTDDTAAVARQLAAQDLRVVQLSENQGVSGARNAGVEAARGQYVVLLDSDDEFLPGILEVYAGFLAERPGLDLIWCGTECCVEDENAALVDQYVDIVKADSSRDTADDRMFAVRLGTGAGIAMKKQAYQQLGGFDTSLPVAEDRDFFIRALEADLNYCSVNKALVRTHHHQADSLMNTNSEAQRLSRFEAVETVLDKHLSFLTQKTNLDLFIRLSLVMVNRFYQHGYPSKARLHARRILKAKPFYFKLIKRVIRYELKALLKRPKAGKA